MPTGKRKKRVTGIGGIFLRSDHPERLAKWYRDHLGIEARRQVATFSWTSPRPGHRTGNTVWAVLSSSERDWGPARPTAQVNYRVLNLDHVLDRLRKEGAAVSDRVEDSKYGRFGWVDDPDGNRIELWQPPRRYVSPERHVPME
jgi:catechol 2,3-dioxygenase-like lactoylglutathione lyase family enzyme